MKRSEIIENLRKVIELALGKSIAIDDYTEDSRLVEDLGLNSIGMLYSVIAIEEFFNIRFENVGFHDFKTIKDVIDYIEERC